ncbi:MAG: class I SAM-dependent RNA methyltransferase [Ignavibacteria bacterium]|nr:class I SAM-dependent RNA methyltransferase [Ignavibacteria bacterium]
MPTSRILITCPKRMTSYLKAELIELGFSIIGESFAGVSIEGTFADTLRLNLHLRTAHRVLYSLKDFRAVTPADLYYHTSRIPWETIVPDDGYVSVVSAVETPSINNTQFANVKCKDAIVDRIRTKTNKRPDSGSDTDRTVVFLYWKGNDCCIYLDTSGDSLSKRGYRKLPHAAPMRETLAAATIMATRWDRKSNFVNPMCGSGTLAIEAALIATNRAPGLLRENFGFMHVQEYNPAVWQSLIKSATSAIIPFNGRIIATDHDAKAIYAIRENARLAGVDRLIEIDCCDFRDTTVPAGGGVVMLNPEYGERLGDIEHLETVYKEIGDFFKKKCSGYYGYIFTGNMDLGKGVGLRAKRRVEFFNADIDCRLFEFELYTGSKEAKE